MPLRSQDPVLRHGAQLETESTLGEETGAMFSEALQSGPIGSLLRIMELDEAEQGLQQTAYSRGRFGNLPSQNKAPDSPLLSRDNASQRVRDEGLESHLEIPGAGMRQRTLDILIDRKREELKRQTILDQSPGGGVRVSARVAASFVGSLVDPSNVALAFVPVVGEARYASLLTRAGGIGGRTGVRAGVGAVEGVVGGAIAEPLNYMANTQQQADYDAYDSMRNIAGGAFFGTALHGGAGLFGDMIRPGQWSAPRIEPVTTPGIASTPDAMRPAPKQYDPTLLAVERERAIVLDRLAEGRPLTREQALEMARANVASRTTPLAGPDSPSYSITAAVKGREWGLTDSEVPGLPDQAPGTWVREIVATNKQGETMGTLLYANDGTPPTIDVLPEFQRQGVATSMLKLAKERGGVVGDSATGLPDAGTTYRTADGQAFREGADEGAVTLRRNEDIEAEADRLLGSDGQQPLSAAVRKAIAEDRFAGVRPVIAQLPGDVQQGMFRMAMAQALTGRPIDVSPALFTHYGDIDGGSNAAMRNAGEVAGADRLASAAADRRLADAPQNEDLATITEAANESEALLKEQAKAAGLEDEDIADMIETGATAVREAKSQVSAFKIAALCAMRAG